VHQRGEVVGQLLLERVAPRVELVVVCQILPLPVLPRPVSIPKQLGLGFDKAGQHNFGLKI
jgi:hypothetical protein